MAHARRAWVGEQIGAWPLRRSLPWSLPLGVIGAAEEEDTARATLVSDGGVCCMEMEEVPRLVLVYESEPEVVLGHPPRPGVPPRVR